MTEGPQDRDTLPREPVVEDRGDGRSPSIAEAADDVAATVLRDRERPQDVEAVRIPDAPDDPADPPVTDGPVNSA
jgi:hypothetical protein